MKTYSDKSDLERQFNRFVWALCIVAVIVFVVAKVVVG